MNKVLRWWRAEGRRMNDLISRQAAIKAIEDLRDCYNGFSDTYDKACIIGVIEEVPPIESVKHAHWVPKHHPIGRRYCECSNCQEEYDCGLFGDYNYCPNCGAKMDGKEK